MDAGRVRDRREDAISPANSRSSAGSLSRRRLPRAQRPPRALREHLTDDIIAAKARDADVERLADVKAIYLESNGTFSVLKRRR
jgi:hypothetical protein